MSDSAHSPAVSGIDTPETVITPVQAEKGGSLLVGTQTIHELLQLSASQNAKRPCLGTRSKGLNGEPGEYSWITYEQVFDKARKFASGLIKLGLQPGSLIGIYAQNSVEWIVALIAAQSASIVVVPLYDVAGPKSIQPLISLCKLSVVIASPSNVFTLAEAALTCHSIKKVILTEISGVDTSFLTKQGVQVSSFEAVLSDGASNPQSCQAPSIDTCYSIVFTSGEPRGVPLTHKNVSSSLSSFTHAVQVLKTDVHVSYLPLVHVMEHLISLQCLISGASIGFWSGHITTLWADLKILRPTLFVGVPSVFNRMYEGIHLNLSKSSALRRLIFSYAYSAKKKLVETGADTTFWDRSVFSKLAEPMGGRVRLFVSGAAPLPGKVAAFLQLCFCCPVVQAYGLTETSGALCSTYIPTEPVLRPPRSSSSDMTEAGKVELPSDDVTTAPKAKIVTNETTTTNRRLLPTPSIVLGTVGHPLECNRIKIARVPGLDCGSHEEHLTGEICVKGANVFEGYFQGPNEPLLRDEAFDKDGWFRTGDIGYWNPTIKAMTIIDTTKSVFKLAQGEYIGTEHLQSLYGGSIYVSQIAIVGRPTETYIVAIVVPSRATISRWANINKVDSTDFADLCRQPAVKRLIFEDLVKCANAQQLRGFQLVRNIHLEPQPWTQDNGFLLAPSGKLNRSKLQRAYKDAVDLLYSQPKMDADRLPSQPKL